MYHIQTNGRSVPHDCHSNLELRQKKPNCIMAPEVPVMSMDCVISFYFKVAAQLAHQPLRSHFNLHSVYQPCQ